MPKKLTQAEWIAKAEAKHGKGRFDYSQVRYVNIDTKVIITCNVCNATFEQTPYIHQTYNGCTNCSVIRTHDGQRKTKEQWVAEAEAKHGKGRFDYSEVVYEKNSKRVWITCLECGHRFQQAPVNHLNRGCAKCAGVARLTTDEFIEKATAIHGDKFDYSEVVYESRKSKIWLTCRECGYHFQQTAGDHLSGRGCPDCAGAVRMTTDRFIEKAQKLHGNKYDYSESVCNGSSDLVKIKCNICGLVFDQDASDHCNRGSGCPACGRLRTTKALIGKTKVTTNGFVKKAITVHGDKYDYSNTKHTHSLKPVRIDCRLHGPFFQYAHTHLNGSGCPECARTRFSIDEWIADAEKVHGAGRYDYSKVVFAVQSEKVTIFCNGCGTEFAQGAGAHRRGSGCQRCAVNGLTTERWIALAIEVHGSKYSYHEVEYTTASAFVTIVCNTCNSTFTQRPFLHLNGHGCQNCAKEKARLAASKTHDQFLLDAIQAHGSGRYEYLSEYKMAIRKIKIKCNQCGHVFRQAPTSHIAGSGCPRCVSSKGENLIAVCLDRLGVAYEIQKKFDGCVAKASLKFDFYIPSLNMCIEYQGAHHYRSVDWYGGEDTLRKVQRRDKIKRKYCAENNIGLIEVPYTWTRDQVIDRINSIVLIQLPLLE